MKPTTELTDRLLTAATERPDDATVLIVAAENLDMAVKSYRATRAPHTMQGMLAAWAAARGHLGGNEPPYACFPG